MMMDYPGTGLTPNIWRDTMELVLDCQQSYMKFERTPLGFRFRRFELVVNEMLEVDNSVPKYNACTAVHRWEDVYPGGWDPNQTHANMRH